VLKRVVDVWLRARMSRKGGQFDELQIERASIDSIASHLNNRSNL
jgi:hypothetical protein